jgi:hypothetical protein
MEGTDKSPGITQRGVEDLFDQLGRIKDQAKHTTVFVSFLQIYNEKVFDLLNPSHS